MNSLEKRLEVLEKHIVPVDDEAMFVHLVGLGVQHDNDKHVQSYRAGGRVFTRLVGESLEALQARVEAGTTKPENGIVVAMEYFGD